MSTLTPPRRVTDDAALTPLDERGRLLFKRDDLFQPYADVPVSGGKVRQARRLLDAHAARIRDEFGGVILSPLGVHSPHGVILTRVAREYGLRVVLFVGATTVERALLRHAMLRRAVKLGATLDASTGVAYEPALERTIERWRVEHGVGFVVRRFGLTSERERDAILGGTSAQVANLPDHVDRIVVAVGAGISAAAILLGVREHRPDVRVTCVQIAGYDRRDTINAIVGDDTGDYDWHTITGIPYARLVRAQVAPGFTLDPIYEAKAFLYARERGLLDERTCFWIVGDSNPVRQDAS